MKRILLVLVMLVVGLPCVSFAAKDTGKTNEIQTQYLERLKTINHDLLKLEDDQAINNIHLEKQQKMELLEIQYRGRVPLNVQIEGNKVAAEEARIKSRTSELEKNRDDLKLDALKYYKGNMPIWLKKEWNKEMTTFATTQYEKINRRMNPQKASTP